MTDGVVDGADDRVTYAGFLLQRSGVVWTAELEPVIANAWSIHPTILGPFDLDIGPEAAACGANMHYCMEEIQKWWQHFAEENVA